MCSHHVALVGRHGSHVTALCDTYIHAYVTVVGRASPAAVVHRQGIFSVACTAMHGTVGSWGGGALGRAAAVEASMGMGPQWVLHQATACNGCLAVIFAGRASRLPCTMYTSCSSLSSLQSSLSPVSLFHLSRAAQRAAKPSHTCVLGAHSLQLQLGQDGHRRPNGGLRRRGGSGCATGSPAPGAAAHECPLLGASPGTGGGSSAGGPSAERRRLPVARPGQ